MISLDARRAVASRARAPAHSARFTEAEHHIEKQQNETAENN
jgi:hypothetical protein